jgi:hypothetical protein
VDEVIAELESLGRHLILVFEPAGMDAATLQAGHRWVLQRFYSRRVIGRRLCTEFGYLPWNLVLRATAPLNLSYRFRLAAAGFLEGHAGATA